MKKDDHLLADQSKKGESLSSRRTYTTSPRYQQMARMNRIVSLLKMNNCPTARKIADELSDLEVASGKVIHKNYSIRTIYRDIDALRNEFHCPILFDRATDTYRLEDTKWEFNWPSYLSEEASFALIIGSHVAEEIIPNPLRARIKKSVDELLKRSNTGFIGNANLKSLKIFAGGGEPENKGVFSVIFDSWRTHRSVKIVYDNQKGSISERIVDPHVLYYHLREWRIKAFCHKSNDDRVFVINRIRNAWQLNETFKPSKKTIDSVTEDHLSSYEKLKDVKIKLTGDAVKFAKVNHMHYKQVIKNGVLFIQEVSFEVAVPWILAQGGQASVIEPAELKKRVREVAQAVIDGNSD